MAQHGVPKVGTKVKRLNHVYMILQLVYVPLDLRLFLPLEPSLE